MAAITQFASARAKRWDLDHQTLDWSKQTWLISYAGGEKSMKLCPLKCLCRAALSKTAIMKLILTLLFPFTYRLLAIMVDYNGRSSWVCIGNTSIPWASLGSAPCILRKTVSLEHFISLGRRGVLNQEPFRQLGRKKPQVPYPAEVDEGWVWIQIFVTYNRRHVSVEPITRKIS